MKNLITVFSLLCALVLVSTAQAAPKNKFTGFVQVDSGNELYVDWVKAKEGEPTVVLINGLTYSTKQWDAFTAALVKKGVGIVRFDPMGMGQTLLKYAPVTEAVDYKKQVEDLNSLLPKLGLKKPYNLLGLSYGGGIAFAYAAKFPKEVKTLIAMAPFTEPLQSQDQWIKNQVAATRAMNPWNAYSDDELYDYFLKQIVYSSYPVAEPIVLENIYKLEATFRMVQGIRHFRAERILNKLPAKTVHLIIAGKDQYIPRDVLEDFWNKLPEDVRLSKTIINYSEHKIPEAVPNFSAALVNELLHKNKTISNGREFEADPTTGIVEYEGGSFKLGKE